MADFKNPGDFRKANLFQGNEFNFAPAPVEEKQLEAAQALFAELPLDDVPPVAALPTGSSMPVPHNPLFVGRAEDLKRLSTIIKGGEAAAAVTGLGGLGKTQLAAEFAHRYGRFFAGGVFWLNFVREEDVQSQVARCGGARGMALREDFDALGQTQQIDLVLGAWNNAMPRLLIFDNCEKEKLFEQ